MNSSSNGRIMIVDDDPSIGPLLKKILKTNGYSSVDCYQSDEEAMKRIDVDSFSLLIVDYRLGKKDGLDFLEKVKVQKPEVPVIIITGYGSVDLAVEAMKRGAFDFLEKPFDQEKVLLFVKRALEHGHLRTEIIRLKKSSMEDSYHGLIGKSPSMKDIFELIEQIKESDVNVLITGSSGSGKEMVARALHETSLRVNQKFIAINCSAIPDTLLEGELFGYKKGAFTDAKTDKIGLFKEADKGTLFLDEIGDMPLTLQPKILRAIQEKEIRPLGTTQSFNIDVRVIAASNQNLKEKIENKSFRDDLFYRLNVMSINLPSLKERPEDIPLLIDCFLQRVQKKSSKKVKGVSQAAMKFLLEYPWPGNIRELENVIERSALLSRDEYILPEDLPFSKQEIPALDLLEKAKRRKPLEEIEKDYILEVLKEVKGNRSEAAKVLSIGRKTLYNKLATYVTPKVEDVSQ